DLMMPEMSGDLLVREARAHPELNAVPIIVLTAKADDELCAKLLREGAQDYLRKPFSAEELQARIRNLVFMKRARQALQQELASQNENLAELALDLIARKRELQESLDSLSQNERRLRRIVDSNMVGILFWQADGQVTDANDAFLTLTGYTRQDLVQGRINWQEITAPEYRGQDERAMEEMSFRGVCDSYEKEYIRKDGRRVPVLIGGALLEESTDRGVRFAIDITERKRAEESLRQSEARKTAILESALDAIITIDQAGTVQEWNPAAERIFGYRKSEALGRKVDRLIIPPAMTKIYEDGLAEYLMTGVGSLLGRPIELTVMRAGGAEFRAELAITRHSWDEPTLYTCFVRDITERKRAEETRNQLAAIVASSDDAIISKTLEGMIVSWNDGAERMFGYSAKEVVGRPITILIPPEFLDEETQILNQLKRGERIQHYETARLRKDGSKIDVS